MAVLAQMTVCWPSSRLDVILDRYDQLEHQLLYTFTHPIIIMTEQYHGNSFAAYHERQLLFRGCNKRRGMVPQCSIII